jgi:hypothetical protein
MKKWICGAFLLGRISVSAAVFYVDIAGSDLNDGSEALPWGTLEHATEQVQNAGDTIFINPGEHTISSVCHLAPGVSVEGAGNSSILNMTRAGSWEYGLRLESHAANSTGNQSISHLRFTGNGVTAFGAVFIIARGGVSIHDCEFEDFDDCAVTFDGQANGGTDMPTVWSVGNLFYSNRVVNCCKEQEGEWMSGALQIGAQEGMRIYGNYFQETERGGGNCGYPIKYFSDGYNRDLKIYDNIIRKLPSIDAWNDWNFAIELWHWMGGVEIYNNQIEGSIDLDHVVRGDYEYGTRIHHNTFGYDGLPGSSGNWNNLSSGLYIEFACSDVDIYQNEFKNLESPIRFSPRNGDQLERIRIFYNLFNQIGNLNRDNGCNLLNFAGENFSFNDFSFFNNSVYAGTNGAGYGLIIPEWPFDRLSIQNHACPKQLFK